MTRERAPLTQALLDALTNEWRPGTDVIAELSARVPPGKARRLYEFRAELAGRPHLRDKPDEYKIRTGARELINKAIGSAVAGNHVERKTVNGVRMLRLPQQEGVLSEDAVRKAVNVVLSGSTGQLPLAFLMVPAEPRQQLAEILVDAIMRTTSKEQDGS